MGNVPNSRMRRLVKVLGLLLLGILALPLLLYGLFYRAEKPLEKLMPVYFDPASHAFLAVGEERLHVRMQGAGTEHVLLLHGSFSSLHTWAGWEAQLARTFRTLSVDLPGHGLTGPSAQNCYNSSCYAALLWEMLDQLHIEKVHVVGKSMGGGVALVMAEQAPERILSLGLISSATPRPLLRDLPQRTEAEAGALPSAREKEVASSQANSRTPAAPSLSSGGAGSRPLIFRLLENPTWSGLLSKATPMFLFRMNLRQVFAQPERITDELVTRYYDMLLREGNRAATLARFRSGGSPMIDYSALSVLPVCIMWGEKDRWIPVSRGKWLSETLPQASFTVFPDVGHVAMEEIPEISAAHYLDFLRTIE
ncbi:MAG: alpha/beta fold hydrolase [Nitritalea sp.]